MLLLPAADTQPHHPRRATSNPVSKPSTPGRDATGDCIGRCKSVNSDRGAPSAAGVSPADDTSGYGDADDRYTAASQQQKASSRDRRSISTVAGRLTPSRGGHSSPDERIIASSPPPPPPPPLPPGRTATTPGGGRVSPGRPTSCKEMESVRCQLETSELWEKFYQLGTEMIITKSGRYTANLCNAYWPICRYV